MIARGSLPKAKMNRLETAYGEHLLGEKMAGRVAWFAFEGVTLKLADDCRLTIDFFVMLENGELEAHDTKGWIREDAMIKLRVAARHFPFRVKIVKRDADDRWLTREVKP